ncbi:hypothetical protein R5H32_19985 [Defluviimonas sp. D31]|nr:hypothetical protein [Defluviimonas sp. D31]MDW4551622.1 hypothetical protein [Defluviimonas sp. D31]
MAFRWRALLVFTPIHVGRATNHLWIPDRPDFGRLRSQRAVTLDV